MSESLTWPVVGARLERELGEPVRAARWLRSPRRSALTWAARTDTAGDLVVKARRGDRAYDKTEWCAVHLPLLGARGYPVPSIVWHGLLDDDWHVVVQNRLPGHPLWPLTSLSRTMLESLLRLVELQADAGVPAGDRDFIGYVADVLFEDWDDVWADAERASPRLCARIRRWLRPVWGLRLAPVDYAHNDLNLSNVLTDGNRITGVVDWDEFGLGSRALDLVVLAFDCERIGSRQAADQLLARAASITGGDALRCLVSYRALTQLGGPYEGQDPSLDTMTAVVSAILDRLQGNQGGRR